MSTTISKARRSATESGRTPGSHAVMQVRLHAVEVAAEMLGVKRSTAYEEIRLGRLRTVRVGRRRLVPTEYIDAYVEMLKAEARTLES